MSDRKLLTRKQLMKLARQARGDRDQEEVADHLDVSQEAVSQAENNVNSSTDKLRIEMIKEYLGITVRGPKPYFEVLDDQA